ncbi:radical SAM protein [Brevundimonas sp. 2R-24]|uniref:Radical SAM protein n=1 Tax=Peiella sedimenti TaxID=3061083 RepID=A0ABT8SKB7_9CAUL|nr:radical SAM protein [Caulobacteraceae bacterium XZ-24]
MVTLIDTVTPSEESPNDATAVRAEALKNHVYPLDGTKRTPLCMLAFTTPCQEPDGSIRLCSASSTFGYARETNMGNAQKIGMAEVWAGEKYRHIRKSLMTGDQLEPYCAACEYRFHGEAWMFQLHLALFAYSSGVRDAETLGLIRRWCDRYAEYAAQAPDLGLEVHPLPELDRPAPAEPRKGGLTRLMHFPGWRQAAADSLELGETTFNTALPESIIAGRELPVYIDFNTLNRCNVSCIMCPPAVLHDDKGVARDEYYRLSLEEFTEICGAMNVKTAHFVGAYAEPLLNKDIFDLIALAKSKGAFTAITTNATPLVPAFAEKLLDAGLDMMTVSLHGATAKTAESIMRKSSFERVVANLKHLQKRKKERGMTKPDVFINFVSQRANVEEIPDFMNLAHEMGVEHVHIIHLIDGGLDDKSTNLIYYPELLGPAIVEAKRRAKALGVNAYISPAYTEIVSAYEASLNGAGAA